jgi:hypothetical protein
MFRISVFILVGIVSLMAGDIYLDTFHAIQNRHVFYYEQAYGARDSFQVGVIHFKEEIKDNRYDFKLYSVSYRRYVASQDHGVFYSFGVRSGPTKVHRLEKTETELLIMPYYDVGVKARLSDRWFHIIGLEVGYLMLYTDDINVQSILGLQVSPSFSFGYRL